MRSAVVGTRRQERNPSPNRSAPRAGIAGFLDNGPGRNDNVRPNGKIRLIDKNRAISEAVSRGAWPSWGEIWESRPAERLGFGRGVLSHDC